MAISEQYQVRTDALFLDELPAGSKLYFYHGSVVIACGTSTSSRALYVIHQNGNIQRYGCNVNLIKPGKTKFINNIDKPLEGCIENPTAAQSRIELLPTLFPSINESILSMINALSIDIAIELATTLEIHPLIRAGNYPIQYIAILLWQDNGEAILDTIENQSGHITTTHLCDALGIPNLTGSMKQFIRMVKPCHFMSSKAYLSLIQTVLQQWQRYKAVFCNSREISMLSVEVNAICKLLDAYPVLFEAKWFCVKQLRLTRALPSEELIQRVYNFYVDERKARNKPVPASASSIQLFLTRYIRSFTQLWDLYDQAENEFTENADDWLIDTYPDDYTFRQLPDFEDNQSFSLIRTAGQLRATAKKLHNCAAGYLHEAAMGTLLFFAYEYAPGQSLYCHRPDDPDHPVSGLLALRREELRQWHKKDMEWSQLVEEFAGYRNRELGEHAWNDLYGLLHCEF